MNKTLHAIVAGFFVIKHVEKHPKTLTFLIFIDIF